MQINTAMLTESQRGRCPRHGYANVTGTTERGGSGDERCNMGESDAIGCAKGAGGADGNAADAGNAAAGALDLPAGAAGGGGNGRRMGRGVLLRAGARGTGVSARSGG
jgi:hypothetical protein